jgi:hypothetical protein
MKRGVVLTLLLLVLHAFADSEVVRLQKGGFDYVLLKESYDLYESKGVSIKFYKEEQSEDLSYQLTFVVADKTGGCLGKSIQQGVFTFDDYNLTLYTRYTRSGSIKEAPEGVTLKRYRITEAGSLKLLSAKIYIEAHDRTLKDESGMRFLYQPPRSDTEKRALTRYLKTQEKNYGGRFVLGEEADSLRKEVQNAFKKRKKLENSVWGAKFLF